MRPFDKAGLWNCTVPLQLRRDHAAVEIGAILGRKAS
jgi:hypothetical protein